MSCVRLEKKRILSKCVRVPESFTSAICLAVNSEGLEQLLAFHSSSSSISASSSPLSSKMLWIAFCASDAPRPKLAIWYSAVVNCLMVYKWSTLVELPDFGKFLQTARLLFNHCMECWSKCMKRRYVFPREEIKLGRNVYTFYTLDTYSICCLASHRFFNPFSFLRTGHTGSRPLLRASHVLFSSFSADL